MTVWESLAEYWHVVADSASYYWREIAAAVAAVGVLLPIVVIPWVLTIKRETTSAIAWCLLVLLVPVFGVLFFIVFGYQSVHRPLVRKVRHRRRYREAHGADAEAKHAEAAAPADPDRTWEGMGRLALRLGAFPLTAGNKGTLFYEGRATYDAMLEAIRNAEHHIHMEFFILQPDDAGREFIEALAAKAKQGVEVRFIYDAMGSRRLGRSTLRPLKLAGGKYAAFLPVNLLRRRIQVNLRNHRKILVVDGKIAFVGGFNIGDEYLGKVPAFGHWRDTHLRLEGPSVESLQRVFVEDWDFAYGELLNGDAYFRAATNAGDWPVQIVQSGPDQELKSIREVYFAAALKARKRLWITSPYYVPDQGLRDILGMAARSGIDVRLLFPFHPDKYLPYFAAHYYFSDLLDSGVKVYQYTKGFVHAKVWLADGQWASVGSANLDNRSLLLNFETNALIYSPKAVADLEAQFQRDLETSIRLEAKVFARRPFSGKLAENLCRLMSPVL